MIIKIILHKTKQSIIPLYTSKLFDMYGLQSGCSFKSSFILAQSRLENQLFLKQGSIFIFPLTKIPHSD